MPAFQPYQPRQPKPNYGGMAKTAVQGAQGAGFFDPMGSPAIRAALERRARRSAESQRQRTSAGARFHGLDPYQTRVAMLDTDRETGQGTADFLNNSRLQEMLSNRDWSRGVLGQERGFEMEEFFRRMNDPGWETFLGQLLGEAGGSFLGGWGGAVGKRMGGGKP